MSEEVTRTEEIDVSRVTADEVKERMDKGEPLAFVDSRSEKSWGEADAQIPGSVRVPPDRAEELVSGVPKDRSVVTYCT